MNRDFLKEAIADAKAVKESAIANAKAALEESFTPHLKTMLSAKLQEMDDTDEKDSVKEEAKAEKNDKISEKLSDPVMRKGLKGDNTEEKETEKMRKIDEDSLDEVLAEIEEAEDKEEVKEDARTDAEEEGYEDGMEDEKEDLEGEADDAEAEEIDLEDMNDEDLKAFIEDVIEDMVTAGEIEAGDNFEEEEVEGEEVEVEDTEDVEVEDETTTDVDVEVTESKQEVNEIVGVAAGMAALFGAAGGMTALQLAMEKKEKRDKYPKVAALLDTLGAIGSAASQAKLREDEGKEASEEDLAKLEDEIGKVFEAKTSYEEDDSELKEAYTTIETLRTDLNEINLLNAKLLYTNKIFKSKNLNENDKVKVLTNFDKATTVKEAKLIYDTLVDLKPKRGKRSIKENLGRASKSAGIAPKKANKKPIVESNQMVDRFKKLAGII